ncbi:MAG: YjbQ family protein [Gammaproteobacteria bacterium]|nr:YjbQ family protein [Gammaproteobacteria bacterium]
MIVQEDLRVQTRGRGTVNLTPQIEALVAASGAQQGLCNVFIAHTSASLMICENADPQVRTDLEAFMRRLVPDGDPLFVHVTEGPDDMPAHVRSILTQHEVTVPIRDGCCALGAWQGIYLWEHRLQAQRRRVTVTVYTD